MPATYNFEIYSECPQRTAKFYTEVFGWTTIKTESTIDRYIVRTYVDKPESINREVEMYFNTEAIASVHIKVPSIKEFLKRVERNGGEILTPIKYIPDIGLIAHFQDTERNAFEIREEVNLDSMLKLIDDHNPDNVNDVIDVIEDYRDQPVLNPKEEIKEIPKKHKEIFFMIVLNVIKEHFTENKEIVGTIAVILDIITRFLWR